MRIELLIDDFVDRNPLISFTESPSHDSGQACRTMNGIYLFKASLTSDKSLIAGGCSETDNGKIVRAIIGLAHHLNLQTPAEGVESSELEFLRSHHRHFGQGCLFSRLLSFLVAP